MPIADLTEDQLIETSSMKACPGRSGSLTWESDRGGVPAIKVYVDRLGRKGEAHKAKGIEVQGETNEGGRL